MKKIGFIGAYDKSNFIIYVAKLLELLGYKILVVDATSGQKIKYIVPSINPTKAYITDFENIDFAVGFDSWKDIEKYLGIRFDTNLEEELQDKMIQKNDDAKVSYDYVIIDLDEPEKIDSFDINNNEKNYFVTSFDMYSLRKGVSILKGFSDAKLTKILFSYEAYKEDEIYLNHLSMEYKIEWNEYTIYFRIFGEDNKVFEENQRLEKIRYRRLSQNYKDSLAYVVQDIEKKQNLGSIKKLMKE